MVLASGLARARRCGWTPLELLLLLGTAIVLVVERPAVPQADQSATSPELSLRHPRILDNI